MADEAAAQRFLRSLIEKGTFLSTIEGVDSIRRAAAAQRDERVVPILSIDSIQRERTILAADTALSALDHFEMVSGNMSISRSAGEILRPDFVFSNRRWLNQKTPHFPSGRQSPSSWHTSARYGITSPSLVSWRSFFSLRSHREGATRLF